MCKAYDELNEDQKDMFDGLAQILDREEPVAWLPVVAALKDHLEIEALSQVPFRRPENVEIKIAG
jgi:hypothetical protein